MKLCKYVSVVAIAKVKLFHSESDACKYVEFFAS